MAYRVAFDAFYHFAEDDGWAMASHVALSILLAVFPFLIFGTALANFLGADQFSDTAVHLIFDTWPEAIAKPIYDQVQQVWYAPRLASLGYVVIAVMIFTAISTALVAVPVALRFTERRMPWLTETLETVSSWSVYGTILVLVAGLLVSHLWLPAGRRGILDVLPGILATLLAWTIGALIFAYYIATFANYTATYAGLASIMIVIVFLYMIGVIFLLGAELNAALLKYRVRERVAVRLFDAEREEKTSKGGGAGGFGG